MQKIVKCYFWILGISSISAASHHENNADSHTRNKRFAVNRVSEGVPDCERPDVYICEEVPDEISPLSTKQCNYRNIKYQEQVFRWVAGRGCLLYTPDFFYKTGILSINLSAGCFYGNYYAPCLEIPKSNGTCGCYPFDPSSEEVAQYVRDTLVPAAEGRWERCFRTASDCCTHQMGDEFFEMDHEGVCDATFDGWTCWPKTNNNTIAEEVCSEFVYSSHFEPPCNHYSKKTCFENGTWELQTDYSRCSLSTYLLFRYHFHVVVISISILTSLPAVFIFSVFRRLWITSVTLHRNLLIAIIIKSILVVACRIEIDMDELLNSGDTVMSNHGLTCKILVTTKHLAANAVLMCFLVEGIYLHRKIVSDFIKKQLLLKLYVGFAATTLLSVMPWIIIMSLQNDHSCWLIYSNENIHWTLDAPKLAVILINTGLFLDITRVLITKIKNHENVKHLETTKATLLIMAIFGTEFILTLITPPTRNCILEETYYYATYTIEALEAFTVALLFCYLNKEVHLLLGFKKILIKEVKNRKSKVNENQPKKNYPNNISSPVNISQPNRIAEGENINACETTIEAPEYSAIVNRLHVAEVVSIQASERLTEIIDPFYEVVIPGANSDIYENLEAKFINYPSAVREKNLKTNAANFNGKTSSLSIDCDDWVRCISSPTSSVYDNSLNEYEVKYLEMKFPLQTKVANNASCGSSETKICDYPMLKKGHVEQAKNTLLLKKFLIKTSSKQSSNVTENDCSDDECVVSEILRESGGSNTTLVSGLISPEYHLSDIDDV